MDKPSNRCLYLNISLDHVYLPSNPPRSKFLPYQLIENPPTSTLASPRISLSFPSPSSSSSAESPFILPSLPSLRTLTNSSNRSITPDTTPTTPTDAKNAKLTLLRPVYNGFPFGVLRLPPLLALALHPNPRSTNIKPIQPHLKSRISRMISHIHRAQPEHPLEHP